MTTITGAGQSASGRNTSLAIEEPTLASERLVELLRRQEAAQQETVFRVASRLKVVFFIFIICVVIVTAVGSLILFSDKLMDRLSKTVHPASSTKTVDSGHSETPPPESMEVSSDVMQPEKTAESGEPVVSSRHTSTSSVSASRRKTRKPVSRNDGGKKRSAKRQGDAASHPEVRSDSPLRTSDHYEKQVDMTAFYEPVGSSKKTSRRRRSRRGRRGRYLQSSTTDTLSIKAQTALIKEKINLIRILVHRYHGKIDRIIDYNSSYYKVKMVIPPDQLNPFQKALSDEATSTKFTVQKEESTPEKTCLIFELFTR